MSSGKKNTIIIGIIVALVGSAEFWNLVWRTPDMVTSAFKEEKKDIIDSVDKSVQAQFDLMYENIPKIIAVSGLMEIDSTPSESLKHLTSLISFGDKRMAEHKKFTEKELPFIRKLMSRERSGYIKCAYVEGKNGKPMYWVTCDGQRRRIFFGKPNRRLVNDVYYYQGDDGKARILSALSSVVIR